MKTSRVAWIVEVLDSDIPRDQWDPVSMPLWSREAARNDARYRNSLKIGGLRYRIAKYVRDVNA